MQSRIREKESPSRQYIEKHQLDVLFKELLVTLLLQQPNEPIPFLLEQLKERAATLAEANNTQRVGLPRRLSSDPDPFAYTTTVLQQPTGLGKKSFTQRFQAAHGSDDVAFKFNRRGSVSAESLSMTDKDDDGPTIVIPKSDEARHRIMTAIGSNLLFRNLEVEQRRPVVDAMFEKKVSVGEVVIKQGEEGDNFYVVDSGTFDIFVNDNKVVDVGPGDSFGELALMYNTPRAATIKATSDGVLWGVDRVTFRKSITGYSFRKRKMYTAFLKTVTILANLQDAEIAKLSDALEPIIYEDGDDIIEQDDEGHRFYLIEKGGVEVTKISTDGTILHLPSLSAGDYFGELALLHNQPRAATVTAKGQVRVAALAKDAFVRLLGPAVEVMERHTVDYEQIDQQISEEMLRNNNNNNNIQLNEPYDDTSEASSTANEDN
ncbi:cyclic nucleotide-binding-like protein [Syncephalis fuscata]|nr:cyclic nucleotide-binding-like protein [Syncephalis fuscata]